jgi:hypothetical protein
MSAGGVAAAPTANPGGYPESTATYANTNSSSVASSQLPGQRQHWPDGKPRNLVSSPAVSPRAQPSMSQLSAQMGLQLSIQTSAPPPPDHFAGYYGKAIGTSFPNSFPSPTSAGGIGLGVGAANRGAASNPIPTGNRYGSGTAVTPQQQQQHWSPANDAPRQHQSLMRASPTMQTTQSRAGISSLSTSGNNNFPTAQSPSYGNVGPSSQSINNGQGLPRNFIPGSSQFYAAGSSSGGNTSSNNGMSGAVNVSGPYNGNFNNFGGSAAAGQSGGAAGVGPGSIVAGGSPSYQSFTSGGIRSGYNAKPSASNTVAFTQMPGQGQSKVSPSLDSFNSFDLHEFMPSDRQGGYADKHAVFPLQQQQQQPSSAMGLAKGSESSLSGGGCTSSSSSGSFLDSSSAGISSKWRPSSIGSDGLTSFSFDRDDRSAAAAASGQQRPFVLSGVDELPQW